MKKNDWILIIATALYSYLFYKESAGINFFIFSIALILLLLYRDASLKHQRKWLIAAAGTVISGAAVVIYGNWLSLWANIISLGLLSGMSISMRSSVIMTLFHSAYSVASSVVFMIIDAVERRPGSSSSQRSPFFVRLLLVLIPLLITLIFFFLYRGANPIFNEFAKNIRLDFITWQWIFFTLLGFVILYGFFYHKRIKEFAAWDENAPQFISHRVVEENGAGSLFSIRNQYLSGMILFAMLNILLLFVNLLDIQYVFISKTLPPGLSHSENVHQGVELLILSIIIAIAVILFIFRGDMNFYSKNKLLRLFAYIWIVQNMFMVISTIMRNNMYVEDHGLTYKRIGVYVYLSLALIGLITTWIKIKKIRSNWFLFRVNTGVWYVMLVIASWINWDRIIVDHNITHAHDLKSVDKNYLVELGSTALPTMLSYNDSTGYLKEERAEDPGRDWYINEYDRNYSERTLENKLHFNLYRFFDEKMKLGWQSWNYDDSRTKDEIIQMAGEGKLKHISLENYAIRTLLPLHPLKDNIISLDLRATAIGHDLEDLSAFHKLQKLDLSACYVDTLSMFPSLPELKELDLSQNTSLRMTGSLRKAPALASLNLSSCGSVDIRELPAFAALTDLDISQSSIANIAELLKYKKLEKLALRNATVTYYRNDEFPALLSLRVLDISGNDGRYGSNSAGVPTATLIGASKCINLEELNLSNNNLLSIHEVIDSVNGSKLVKLKKLELQNNRLSAIPGIETLQSLTSLNLAYNPVTSLGFISQLRNLEVLDVSGTGIVDLSPLYGLDQLKELYVSSILKSQLDALKKELPKTKIVVMDNAAQ